MFDTHLFEWSVNSNPVEAILNVYMYYKCGTHTHVYVANSATSTWIVSASIL